MTMETKTAQPSANPSAGSPLTAELSGALERHLRDAQYYWDLPGLALGVGTRNGLFYAGTAGVRDIRTGQSLKTPDIFHMASLAKLFTGTGILLLRQDGLLSLDDPVRLHLPWFETADPRSAELTLRQLLTHTSGMPDVTDYHWNKPDASPGALEGYFRSREIRDMRLLWDPSEGRFAYSNIGYDLLGLVIAAVSGQRFEEFMDARIFRPLGMEQTSFFTPGRDPAALVSPHGRNPDNTVSVLAHYPYTRMHAPSSTLTSNLEDMGKWAAAHLSRRVLTPDAYDLAFAPAALVPNNGEHICLSWFSRVQGGYTLYGHEGADDGFRSSLWLCPEADLFVLLCANLSAAPLKKISKQVFDTLFGTVAG